MISMCFTPQLLSRIPPTFEVNYGNYKYSKWFTELQTQRTRTGVAVRRCLGFESCLDIWEESRSLTTTLLQLDRDRNAEGYKYGFDTSTFNVDGDHYLQLLLLLIITPTLHYFTAAPVPDSEDKRIRRELNSV